MHFLRSALAALAFAAGIHAQHFGIEITSDAQPNCWRTDSIVREVTKGAGSDREKALALHKFGMAHLIHFNGPIEQNDLYVTDPTKLIGVYGYALCGNNSAAMIALYNKAGMKARLRWLPYHEVAEVWFDNRWNYLDTDMFGYVFMDDGNTIAGVDDLIRDADLFTRQKNPPEPYFPFDKKSDMASVFRNSYNRKNYHPYSDTHLMRLGLRTGETVRMYYRPQDRYYLREGLPENLGTVWRGYWTEGAVRKGSLAWTDESPATYGNALFEYNPDLKSEAFRKQNPRWKDVKLCEGKGTPVLCAEPASIASLEVEVNTPWVIAGLLNDLADFTDNSDGARVSGEFWRITPNDRNVIYLSLDGGRSWKEVWRNRLLGAIPFQVDLTTLVEGYSSYRLRFEWTDYSRSGKAGIGSLALRTWTQLSPMALPRLESGNNEFRVAVSGERAYHQNSAWHRGEKLPGEVRENLHERSEAPYLALQDRSKPGVIRFGVPTAEDAKELRLSVLLHADGGAKPTDPRAVISISEDGGVTWKQAQRFTPHPEHEEDRIWINQVFTRSEGTSEKTLIQVEFWNAGLERVETSVLAGKPSETTDGLRVTHVWMDGETEKRADRDVVLTDGTGSYQIDVGTGKIRNRELHIEGVAR
jgi:hypothetical protein